MKIKISKKFKFLYKNKQTRINIFYGGRGGGKTTEITIFLIKTMIEKKVRILCLREFNTNNKESVFYEFVNFIYNNNLQNYYTFSQKKQKVKNQDKLFYITNTIIKNTLNDSQIIFSGVNDSTVYSLKSYSNIDICWVEEANFITEFTFNILEPTIRNKNSFLIFTFNPQKEDDFIYKLALNPIKDYITSININFNDNPFFENSGLKKSYELATQRVQNNTLSLNSFNHVWHGIPLINDDCIFNESIFKECIIYDFDKSLKSYIKVVLGIDPATTSKDFSNETGIILVAKTKDEIAHVIGDYSGVITPNELSEIVSNLYNSLRIDSVVIEVNNGGDFIKSVLLNKNPLIPITEVRATRDKKDRASPISVLLSMKRILLLDSIKDNLFTQMKKLTNRGYNGQKGESPDRLEAMEWGVYDLFNLSEANTQNLIFNTQDYKCEIKGYCLNENLGYGIIRKDIFVILIFDLVIDNNIRKINFKNCIIRNCNTFKDFASNYNNFNNILFKENLVTDEYGLRTYIARDLVLNEKVFNAISLINENINIFNVLATEYKGYYGNQLIKALNEYHTELKECIITECFCDVILNFIGV